MSLGRPSPELLPHRPGCGRGPGLERGRREVAALLLIHCVQECFVGHLSAPRNSQQEWGAFSRSQGSVWFFVL